MWLLRPPGVYSPQGDTRLLLDALRDASATENARMLDICTGTGVVALTGARLGAADVHAVDLSARAAMAARWNARLRGLPVTVHRGDFLDHSEGRFDVVTANPPYVPGPCSADRILRTLGGSKSRSWEGGSDGRACLDGLCRRAPRLLSERGVLLVVHSAMCGTRRTLALLHAAGLKASVAARATQPFGPVLHARAAWLEERGLIAPGQREEELVVIRADARP